MLRDTWEVILAGLILVGLLHGITAILWLVMFA